MAPIHLYLYFLLQAFIVKLEKNTQACQLRHIFCLHICMPSTIYSLNTCSHDVVKFYFITCQPRHMFCLPMCMPIIYNSGNFTHITPIKKVHLHILPLLLLCALTARLKAGQRRQFVHRTPKCQLTGRQEKVEQNIRLHNPTK